MSTFEGVYISPEAEAHLTRVNQKRKEYLLEAPKIFDANIDKPIEEILRAIYKKHYRTDYDTINDLFCNSSRKDDWLSWEENNKRVKCHEISLEYHATAQTIEKEKIKTDPSIISYQVMQLLLAKLRPDATELIVKTFLANNKIKTTRRTENAEMYIYVEGIWKTDAETHIKEYCNLLLDKALTTQIINEVLLKISVRTYVEEKDFYKIVDINKIAVENGVIDLETGKLLPHNPDYYFFNKLPIIYIPEKNCANIEKFLKEILKDESDILVIQELLGYLLYRKYTIKKAVMLTGTGDNGKSKLIELMRTFIGAENCTNLPPEKLESDPYAIGELFNKMANLGADIGDTYLKDLSLFKSLTGRDLVSGQRKFKNNINFENFAKFVFSANQLPNSKDKTKAFWSRWVVLDLPYTFVSKKEYDYLKDKTNYKIADEQIIDKITTPEEMSGLLNYAIKGLHRLLQQKDFSFNKSTAEVEDIWLRRASSINAFIKDRIEVSSGEYILKDGFHEAYAEYCNQHKIKPVDDKKIKVALSEIGVYETRKNMSDGTRELILNRIKFKDDKKSEGRPTIGICNLYRKNNLLEEYENPCLLNPQDDKISDDEIDEEDVV